MQAETSVKKDARKDKNQHCFKKQINDNSQSTIQVVINENNMPKLVGKNKDLIQQKVLQHQMSQSRQELQKNQLNSSTSAFKRTKFDRNNIQQQQQTQLKQSKVDQSNQVRQSLSVSQSLRSIDIQLNDNTSKHELLSKTDQNKSMALIKTGRVQRLFQKKKNGSSKIDKKSSSRNQRSLSKSISERNLSTIKKIEQIDLQSQSTVIHNKSKFSSQHPLGNNQYLQPYSLLSTERQFTDVLKLQQQETPSSSSLPSKKDDNEAFKDYMKDFSVKNRDSDISFQHKFEKTDTIYINSTDSQNIDIEVILTFLLNEEDQLNTFAIMGSQGQLLEIQQKMPKTFEQSYMKMIDFVECQKERPKFFAQQLQVTLVTISSLVQVFTPTLLQKFSNKIRNVFTTIHQNFILFIDQILNSCNINPKESLNYILLRKLIVKKLKSKQKSQRLTQFRKNNEVNFLVIKKICRSLIDVQTADNQSLQFLQPNSPSNNQNSLASEYKMLAFEILDVMRIFDQVDISFIVEKLNSCIQILQFKYKLQQSPAAKARPKTSYRANSPKQDISPRTLAQQYNSKAQLLDINYQKQTINRNQSPRQQQIKKNGSKSPRRQQAQSTNAFFLPETMAFLLTNSIECNNGVTNINNNINIYGNVEIVPQKKQGQNGKINAQNGSITLEQKKQQLQQQFISKIPKFLGNQGISRVNQAQSPTARQLNTLNDKNSKIRKNDNQAKSKQKLKNDSSKQRLDNNNQDFNDFSKLDELTPELIDLSRGSSQIYSEHTSSKTLNQYAQQRKSISRRVSDNSELETQSNKRLANNQSQMIKSQNKSIVKKFDTSRDQKGQSQKSVIKKVATPIQQLNSVQITPIKYNQPKINSVNKQSLHTNQTQQDKKKVYQPIVIKNGQKQQPLNNQNSSILQQYQNAKQQQLQQQQVKKQEVLKQNKSVVRINKVEKNPQVKQKLQFYPLEQVPNISTDLSKMDIRDFDTENSTKNQEQPIKFEDDTNQDEKQIKQGEKRLDKLLQEMTNDTPKTTEPQFIKFGSLIEQHIGSFDLKKEMEKLKQIDHEVKIQKRISLKVTPQLFQQNQNQQQVDQNNPTIESPTRKIVLGEFDETKDEDYQIQLNDDLLISRDVSKKSENKDGDQINMQDYVTSQTGMEDPFPDYIDPNEESLALSPHKSTITRSEESKKEEDEQTQLRSQVKVPYLPEIEGNKKYTLVLDLDETLIHFDCDEDDDNEGEKDDDEEEGYYLIRPGAIKFLNELSKYYELVIFTAAMPDYADWILDNVDRQRIIKHRLYRQHTTPHEDYAIKDLRNLGRPLEKTIIIDNLAENFNHTTPNNGIWVESWYDDMDDNILELLLPFLKEIVEQNIQDVRKILTKDIKENIIYRNLEVGKHIPSIQELLNPKPSPFAKSWNIDDLKI